MMIGFILQDKEYIKAHFIVTDGNSLPILNVIYNNPEFSKNTIFITGCI